MPSTRQPRFQEEQFTDGSSGWVAYSPDFEGCIGYGATREEAEAELEKAQLLHRLSYEGNLIPVDQLHGARGEQINETQYWTIEFVTFTPNEHGRSEKSATSIQEDLDGSRLTTTV